MRDFHWIYFKILSTHQVEHGGGTPWNRWDNPHPVCWTTATCTFLRREKMSLLSYRVIPLSSDFPLEQVVIHSLILPAFEHPKAFFSTGRNFSRQQRKKATWLAGGERWRHHHPITFTCCLFAQKNHRGQLFKARSALTPVNFTECFSPCVLHVCLLRNFKEENV